MRKTEINALALALCLFGLIGATAKGDTLWMRVSALFFVLNLIALILNRYAVENGR